jgi:hypothetical protein
VKGNRFNGSAYRALAARDVRPWSYFNGPMPSLYEGMRKNLALSCHDNLNRRRIVVAIYLPIRGLDPAGVVLIRTIPTISL